MSAKWTSRKLILILGKGGVGKTALAQATARHLASQGKRTLLCHVLQLSDEPQRLEQVRPNLWEITLNPEECFREYVMLKVKLKSLYTLFLGNKITQYLQKAAPGVREMVLLGKIWFERTNYDHVVVDMPSTGYALTMINTPFNFADLFPGGPIYHDSKEMIETFSDPEESAFITVTLAEEMPIQESVDLSEVLARLMPENPSWLVVNRLMHVSSKAKALYESEWKQLSKEEREKPLWAALDYTIHKEKQQAEQLEILDKIWAARKPWLELAEVAEKEEVARFEALETSL